MQFSRHKVLTIYYRISSLQPTLVLFIYILLKFYLLFYQSHLVAILYHFYGAKYLSQKQIV